MRPQRTPGRSDHKVGLPSVHTAAAGVVTTGPYGNARQTRAWATMTFSPLKVMAGPSCSA